MFEYKVVPAPTKGVKAKGVKGAEARFAFTVEQAINDLAADGWEYVRTDVLPSEERVGLTGSVTNWRNLMVFRRGIAVADDAPASEAAPVRVEPVLTAAAVSSAVPEGGGIAEAEAQETDAEAREAEAYEEGSEETRPT
ncbi:DUF4177 domain-containing protein [Marivita sp. S6314]|uniref:DUF4177 domain-containing protein n=1 Tax=Marivita sp. S6314 TaxID=2926406 RepID=UPI001FF5663F|nr:DUF4177 domain-containing protein [Marivita sp. S6314]MCK0148950.1 DUF4177 domain-containing protein [Marivita sp. S6314]